MSGKPQDEAGAGPPPRRRGPEPPGRASLEAVRARHPEALAAFFERYGGHVYGLAFRLLGAREGAEDVTQEVFFKVQRAAHRLDPARDPLPWITAITYNACRDLWRSSAHRLERHSDSLEADPALAERLPGGGGDPESVLLGEERERRVQEALLALPESLRAAIVLHDYEGLDHREVAVLTGIGHAAARKRYSRALAALGRLLRGTPA